MPILPLMPDPNKTDTLVKNFRNRELANDHALIPSEKRRIARKVYKLCKASFYGTPIIGIAIQDICTEVALAGTKKMVRKVAWTPVVVFLFPAVTAAGLSVYKICKKDRRRRTAAFVTNVVGLVYTYPTYLLDRSCLGLIEIEIFRL